MKGELEEARRQKRGKGKWGVTQRYLLVIQILILLIAIAIFVYQAKSYNFVQDDSYITYRYAKNIIKGLGPVFNPDERVEGYTNFLWLMLLSSLGILGLPFSLIIPLSQILGLLCAVATLIIFFLFLRCHSQGPTGLNPLATLLLSANGAYAYWSVSGMETGLFTLLLALAFFVYFRNKTPKNLLLTSALLGLSTLTRPEGALFEIIVVIHFLLAQFFRPMALPALTGTNQSPQVESPRPEWRNRLNLRLLFYLLLPFILLVLPLSIWRLAYYHRLFPNTFYAKTGLSFSYIISGIRYLGEFYKAYGLWGIAFIAPVIVLIIKKRLNIPSPLFGALLLIIIYTIYVVLVGGDVLRIWRFFVPILFFFYFLLGETVFLLSLPKPVSAGIILLLSLITFFGPFAHPMEASGRVLKNVRSQILWNRNMENGLVRKMRATGEWLKNHLREEEWFACTTIGAVSFYSERNMIDMLGLTDSTIALHPENILGPKVYWKERNYNTRYLLERLPRYIYFSTGMKPSAAAERALFLRTRFRVGYFPTFITVMEDNLRFNEVIYQVKPGADTLPIETPGVNPEFVDLYNQALNLRRHHPDSAIVIFWKCISIAPEDFAPPYEWLGEIYYQQQEIEKAVEYLEKAIAIDDYCITAHSLLGEIYGHRGEWEKSAFHFGKVVTYAPYYYNGYLNLSLALLQIGKYNEAESVLTRAVKNFPHFPELQTRLDQVRLLLNSNN